MDDVQLAKSDGPRFDQAKFTGAAKHIHERQEFTPQMMQDEPVKALTRETYTALSAAINIGREVPPELRVALEENTFIFSGFKTYQQLREVSGLLKDEDGGFKSFEAFSRDIQQLNDRYNKNYLRAEYNYATQSTQMAVKWHDFVADGDDYLLQYRTSGDDRVRAEHAALHGVTLPIGDAFWDEYLPPLDWGCRCTVVQVPREKYQQSDPDEAKALGEAATAGPKKKIFRFNPGKTMKIFPPKHPYLPKGCGKCSQNLKLAYNPASQQCQVCGKIKDCMDEFFGKKTTIAQYENGGVVESYQLDTQKADYKNVLSVAKAFAEKGAKVVMTPRFDHTRDCPEYLHIYGSLIGTKYQGRCPDLLIDGKWYEHEGYTTPNSKNAFANMVSHGLKQSDRIIIEECGLTDGYMLRSINGRVQSGKTIEEVWIHSSTGVRLLYKKTEGR